MAKFWSAFRLLWIERLAYQFNFFLEILSGILSSLIVLFLWMAIYRYSAKDVIAGYSLGEMVTYLLGAGLINSFILTTAENPETSQSIQYGILSTLLIQPINPYGIWFVRDLGSKAFYFLLGLTGYLGVCLYSLVSHAMQPGARDKLNHMDAFYGEPFLALVRKRAVEGSIFRA